MRATTWRRLNRRRDHHWSQHRFSTYLDGELSPRQEQRLADHAEICPECARLIATLQAVLAMLPSLRLPPSTAFAIAERTAERVGAQLEEWS